jgi:hypothetical protein
VATWRRRCIGARPGFRLLDFFSSPFDFARQVNAGVDGPVRARRRPSGVRSCGLACSLQRDGERISPGTRQQSYTLSVCVIHRDTCPGALDELTHDMCANNKGLCPVSGASVCARF